MDPFLEGELWQEFHETLAGAIRAQLMAVLPSSYVALLAKRYLLDRPALGVFDIPSRAFYPDVHVIQPRPSPAAVAEADRPRTDEPSVELASFVEVPQLSVEVRDVAQRRLVTVIEILSPVNKHGEGAREYLERRMQLLHAEVHLLEIDLLRQGARIPLLGDVPLTSYYIYLSRSQRRPFTQVWALTLRDRLPTVPVPLLAPDPDAPLDLQGAIGACFDLVGYERLLDYTVPLAPPELTAADARWLESTLREAGRRG